MVRITQEHDRAIKPARLNTKAVDEVLAKLRESEPDLHPFSHEMLTINALVMMAERRILPTGAVEWRHTNRCVLLAVDAMVRSAGANGREWFSAMRGLCRLFALWHCEVIEVARKFNSGTLLAPHEAAILENWWSQRLALGVPREFRQFALVVKTENQKLGLSDNKGSIDQDLAVFREVTKGTPGGVYIGNDRRMRLGWRQYRDTMAALSGVPRGGDTDPVANPHLSFADQAGEDGTVEDALPAPNSTEPRADQRHAAAAALGALPPGMFDLIRDVANAIDAEVFLDALDEASRTQDAAEKAAILRRGSNEKLGRDRLAEALGTTVSKIRTAEEKLNFDRRSGG
jgi:hypothetical protein